METSIHFNKSDNGMALEWLNQMTLNFKAFLLGMEPFADRGVGEDLFRFKH